MRYKAHVNLHVAVTSEDIDDIMCSALEGGINYWCNEAKVKGEFLGEYASEQISRKGTLLLRDAEENKVYELTLEKLLKGIELAIEGNYRSEYNWWCNARIDTCNIDAEVADAIVQLALFGDMIYG